MYFRYFLHVSVFVFILLTVSVNYAQEQSPPVVGIVSDSSLNTLTFSSASGESIQELVTIFQSLGAEVRSVNLSNAIEDDVDLLVLVRPRRTLNVIELARIWLHTEKGNNFLLAVDPQNYQGLSGEQGGRGLSLLLELGYGIGLQNDFLAEKWFTTNSIEDILGTRLITYPENIIMHPIVAPMVFYQLPVHIWGGRSLDVEPFIPDAWAVPLIYTETAYGEVNQNFANAPQALLLTVPDDYLGRLLVAAVAESSETGSKIALLGDSELLEDAFGLSRVSGATRPQYVGNRVFAQRLVAWLLNIPESDWPGLPNGFTWIRLDGQNDDWGDLATDNNSTGDLSEESIQAFSNDQFLYIMLDSMGLSNDQLQMEISMAGNGDEEENNETVIRIDSENNIFVVGEDEPIRDAQIAIDQVIEIRLPLRVVGRNNEIRTICLFSSENPFEPQDCSNSVIPNRSSQFDPVPVRFSSGPLVTISSNGPTNLSSDPDEDAPVIGVAQSGEFFIGAGRTADADWLKVENGRFSGWIQTFLVAPNSDVMTLPVIEN